MIVGLCGDIGSGKTTVSKHLVTLGFVPRSFAGPLKRGVAAMLGVGVDMLSNQEFKKGQVYPGGPTYRQVLERIGTEGGRGLAEDFWVRISMDHVDRLLLKEPDTDFVFDDLRFPNEFAAVRERGGQVWLVERTTGPAAERTGHASDEAWRGFEFDRTLSAAKGDLNGLAFQAEQALGDLGGA